MRALLAIAKQTVRASVRSRVFHLLVFLTLLAVFLLPLTVSGDGTAVGELQVILTYSVKATTCLLMMAALWLGCSGLAGEIEAYNLHLVLSKPAPAWVVWVGKWLGIFVMIGAIFLVSNTVMFGLVIVRMQVSDFPEVERARARAEVLVGRRVFHPEPVPINRLARKGYEEMRDKGRLSPDHDPKAVIAELTRQVKARSTSVEYNEGRVWYYRGVKAGEETQVFVRYRLYVSSTSQSKQRFTQGVWAVINPDAPEESRAVYLPQRVMSGTWHELAFPGSMVSETGSVILQYGNADQQRESITFQVDDGPQLMVRVAGFAANWYRAAVLNLLKIGLMAAVGCAFGGAFSSPVAIFVAASYLILGAFADPTRGAPEVGMSGQIAAWKLTDMLNFGISWVIGKLVVSFNEFDVSFPLARGYLIEFSRVLNFLVFQCLLRGAPLALLGIWILTRRELGKVIRR